ncbi:MAG: hypothetical protein Kow0029_01680 [Candidatus Rifleibacteriota bacterium]
MNTKIVFFLFLSSMLLAANISYGWGPVSHISLTYESGKENGFPVSSDLLGAYLAGSTEPDIGLDDGKSEDYGVYHSEDFAKAMESVARRKKSPDREILMARAAGIRSHIAGDSAAHGQTGYSEAKTMFPDLETGLPKHTTNELIADIIMYDRNRYSLKRQTLNFIDVDTMIEVRKEFTKMTGKKLVNDRAKLKKEILNHKAMVLTELSLADHISATDQKKIQQMKEVYSDLDAGVTDSKGASLAKIRIAENAKPCENLSNFKTSNQGFKIKNFLTNSLLSKSFQSLERGALKFFKSAIIRDSFGNFAEGKVGTTRNKAFVNFGMNLLNKDLTFKQAVIMAGKATSGYPEDPEQKLAYLEIEAQALKAARDKALEAYNNRPWWKFWLYFTQADKMKYLKAQDEYSKQLALIDRQRKLIAEATTGSVSEEEFNQALVESSQLAEKPYVSNADAGSDSLSELQAKVDAAYQKFVAAANSQDHDDIRKAEQELYKAKELLNKAMGRK